MDILSVHFKFYKMDLGFLEASVDSCDVVIVIDGAGSGGSCWGGGERDL